MTGGSFEYEYGRGLSWIPICYFCVEEVRRDSELNHIFSPIRPTSLRFSFNLQTHDVFLY